ncbi:MAG: DUF3782 domain-containing protein [Anaerolineae bacterium]|nr:DUF3782 domain-containing protein [Anaerolineae bacterium]
MENHQIRQLIRRELPALLRRDSELREWVLSLTREQYADKRETESRFECVLEELRRDREENRQELRTMREEQNRKWEANRQELQTMREEQNRKWEANQQELRTMREEQNRKWEEQNRKWEEQNRKWEANTARLDRILDRIEAQAREHTQSIGALGARWGPQTEASFRNALAGILTDSFGVEVLNVTEYDATGEVFGRPDQVELDVIIQDGILILCEIKSSMSKSDMVIFDRKVRFYEQRHTRKADRVLVISPMVDARARALAAELGIEVYSYVEDVTLRHSSM